MGNPRTAFFDYGSGLYFQSFTKIRINSIANHTSYFTTDIANLHFYINERFSIYFGKTAIIIIDTG